MLKPSGQNSNGQVEIGRIGVKRSGEDGGGILLDVDLIEEVNTEEEAMAIDVSVPGALRLWRASSLAIRTSAAETHTSGAAAGARAASASGTFGMVAVKPPDVGVILMLGAGENILSHDIEIRGARLKSTPKACTFALKVRFAGLSMEDITKIVSWFGTTIAATFVPRQAPLPFPGTAGKAAPAPVQTGDIVSGYDSKGVEYAGVVMQSVNDEGTASIEVDDCGSHFIVPMATIAGTFKVAGDGGKELIAQVGVFVKACKKAKTKPTWTHLVAALGRAYLGGEDTPDGAWALTNDIISAAVDASREDRVATESAAAAG